MSITLNKAKLFTVTYGEDAAKWPYFQDGLYFNSQGQLIDCPHNTAHLRASGRMEEVSSRTLVLTAGTDGSEVVKPGNIPMSAGAPPRSASEETLHALAALTDAEVYAAAQNLVEKLTAAGVTDFNFTPAVDTRDENANFIAQWT